MKINRNNYEVYFIDYLEGKLDEKLVDDFLEFLLQNPDLKQELTFFESVSVVPEEISFDKKELLFKEKFDSEIEFNRAAISILEGDSSSSEKAEFEKYLLTHPQKDKEIQLFNKTKLLPDTSVTFSKKNKLYKKPVGRTIIFWSARVAAILLLALTFYILIDNSSEEIVPQIQVAENKDEGTKKETSPEVKQVPVETEKQKTESTKKLAPKPAVKEVKQEPKNGKSLRETSKGRLEREDVAEIRSLVPVPKELKTIAASFEVQKPDVRLAAMNFTQPEIVPGYTEERLLADVVIEKTGLDKLSLNKITKAGLNLVSALSKEKFQYETNKEGKIVEYNYDSRLLAFTIPANNTERGE
jgi:hypothetical protein